MARSTKDMFEQYVKFPTVSICIGSPYSEAIIGFEDTGARPMNTTLDTFQFVRHLKNGYAKKIMCLVIIQAYHQLVGYHQHYKLYIESRAFMHISTFRSDIPIKIEGRSLNVKDGYIEKQGSKIGVHAIAKFYGHCMDFTVLEKTPIGRRNRV